MNMSFLNIMLCYYFSLEAVLQDMALIINYDYLHPFAVLQTVTWSCSVKKVFLKI